MASERGVGRVLRGRFLAWRWRIVLEGKDSCQGHKADSCQNADKNHAPGATPDAGPGIVFFFIQGAFLWLSSALKPGKHEAPGIARAE